MFSTAFIFKIGILFRHNGNDAFVKCSVKPVLKMDDSQQKTGFEVLVLNCVQNERNAKQSYKKEILKWKKRLSKTKQRLVKAST